MDKENWIIIGLLLIVLVFAVIRTVKHFSGGGCCGGGGKAIRPHKKLTQPVIGRRILSVEGMHCENCQARVEDALDHLDGVVCKVNLRKKTAAVSYTAPVSDEVLKEAVEKLGYRVTDIR